MQATEYSLFLGCTVPVRARNYELSTRKVAEALGLKLLDLEGFVCCGFPIKSVHHQTFLLTAASNLIVAEERGMNICTLCSACTAVLTEVNRLLGMNEALRAEVLKKLGAGKDYKFGKKTKVKHFARILYEEVGIEKIKEMTGMKASGLRVAPHYGCHYLKPSEIYDDFDDPEHPKTLVELIGATGATPVKFENMTRCCGAGILAMNENVAFSMTCKKLDAMKAADVDAVALICPFCSVMYDNNQPAIEEKFAKQYGLPVLYYPQLLGLALGIPSKELGFAMNRVKADAVLERSK